MESSLEKVTKIKEILDYQDKSVISKTILDRETGSVTLFAFYKDQGLNEHTAPYDALVHIIEGEAEVVISGKRHILIEGEIILMPAKKPHSLKAIKNFKMILTMIKE